MKTIIISPLFLCFDLLAGSQHTILPRLRDARRLGALYSGYLTPGHYRDLDSLRRFENSRGGASYRSQKEAEIRKKCANGNRSACDYVRNYL